MTAYCYLKAKPRPIIRKKLNPKRKFKYAVWLPGIFLTLGSILLANVILPIIFYQLKSEANFKKKLLVPISDVQAQVLGESKNSDYQLANDWFPTAPKLPPQPSRITHYNISIPKLGIKNAVVEIGGEDLMKSMIQYSGTALPGQFGNPVIFCHSALPQFFSPVNYKTICATLPRIEIRDEFLVDFDGVRYQYQIEKITEVDPADVSVLAQYYDSQYLTIITCVPPGTYLRRLVVRAKLI